MKEREIKKRLRQIPDELPPGGEVGQESRKVYEMRRNTAIEEIEELLEVELREETESGFWDFVRSQLLLISKKTWLLQGLLLFLLVFLAGKGYSGQTPEDVYVLLGAAAPVLALLSVEEISRIYHGSMLEIEYATRYSLQKVVLLRIFLLGSVDVLLLLALMFFFGSYLELSLMRLLVYGMTPFLLMCAGCLELMKKCSGETLKAVSAGMAVLIFLLTQVGMNSPFFIYAYGRLPIWLAVLAGGLVVLAAELWKLNRRLQTFEPLNWG